jgi:hypothetical protein
MTAVLRQADLILRGEQSSRDLPRLMLLVLIFGMFYGAVMGTFSATSLDRLLQIAYAAVKVPILLLVTFLISLPSFFVLNTLMGLRSDFADAVRALITTQAGLTIVLASLAPFTALWYATSADYSVAILFNAFMFALASFTAQFLLRRRYRPLIQRDPKHRILLRLWLVIYVFVGIQMGWVLRPFVGSPLAETRFFREGAFSNAYTYVGNLIWNVLTRGS